MHAHDHDVDVDGPRARMQPRAHAGTCEHMRGLIVSLAQEGMGRLGTSMRTSRSSGGASESGHPTCPRPDRRLDGRGLRLRACSTTITSDSIKLMRMGEIGAGGDGEEARVGGGDFRVR